MNSLLLITTLDIPRHLTVGPALLVIYMLSHLGAIVLAWRPPTERLCHGVYIL